jgi:MoaA/NifB/PqqE/SkfB family radical SAM enzyme
LGIDDEQLIQCNKRSKFYENQMKKTVSFSKDAANVFFHILTRCNLNCRHCYINPEQHGKDTLPLSVINDWLGIFSERHNAVNVIFLGGEPTLHPDLSFAVKRARKLGYQSVTIDTNGYLFNDILSRVTPDEVDYFSFSLDGATRETNDAIRGKGCFDTCISGIQKTLSSGFGVSLIYTASNHNFHELDGMVSLLQTLGIHRFFIQVIGIRGKSTAVEPESLQVPRSDWLRNIPEIAKKVAEKGITVTYPKVFLDPEEIFECAGLVADNYFIFPNGRVYQCPLCEDYPLHSMMIKDHRIMSTGKINERDLFELDIPEGCVMNKLIQPGNLIYRHDGTPEYRVACCLLKEEVPGY